MTHSRPFRAAAALLLALGVVTTRAASRNGASGDPLPPVPTREDRRVIRKSEGGEHRMRVARAFEAEMLTPGAPVDVERYTIDMRVTIHPNRVDGSVRIRARSLQDGLQALDVDLYDEMTVTQVVTGATPLVFFHLNDQVQVTLDRGYDTGELIDLAIGYGGTPPNPGFGSFTFQTHGAGDDPIVSSLSEPTYAPTWWPCIDDPSDKAIVDMNLTVPDPLVGVSNGLLVNTIANPDSTMTYEWRSSYPISTYLVSVAISNYVTWTDVYTPVSGGLADMPVQNWVYPEHFANAFEDLSVTVPMLEFYSGLLGEYPFVDEKYGHAIFPFGGAMEHQTATSYGAVLIRGDHFYDWIVAHELGHQWFGDKVSPSAWPEVWLNEGGATYSEALWREHLGGPPALQAWMTSLDSRPFCGTLYDPVAGGCNLFGATVYDKGGWVLHMLRHVVGDTAFFQGLQDYFTSRAYDSAATSDLHAAMETASGLPLGPFFSRWVFDTGEPNYRWGWSAVQTTAGWVIYVHVDQLQAGQPFIMPLDIVVTSPPGNSKTTHVVQNSMAGQDFVLPPQSRAPTDVRFDPDGWILKTVNQIALPDLDGDGVPDTADNCGMLSNPEQDDFDGDLSGDNCDCAPLDAAIQVPPPEVGGLMLTGAAPASLEWFPVPGGGPGLTYDILRASLDTTNPAGVPASLECLASGLATPSGSDGDPLPIGEGVIYFVRAVETCLGPLGTPPGGSPRPSPACP